MKLLDALRALRTCTCGLDQSLDRAEKGFVIRATKLPTKAATEGDGGAGRVNQTLERIFLIPKYRDGLKKRHVPTGYLRYTYKARLNCCVHQEALYIDIQTPGL